MFFSDNNCATDITQLTFNIGDSAKNFYFKGQYPQASLTFTATDNGAILTAGTAAWIVTAAPGFLGTIATNEDANGNLLWFTQGKVPVAAKQDAPRGVKALKFDSTYTYLYVADPSAHRVLKYNYQTRQYIGWIGGFQSGNGIGIAGSNLDIEFGQGPIANRTGFQVPGLSLHPAKTIKTSTVCHGRALRPQDADRNPLQRFLGGGLSYKTVDVSEVLSLQGEGNRQKEKERDEANRHLPLFKVKSTNLLLHRPRLFVKPFVTSVEEH
jgi:hypothetical protein